MSVPELEELARLISEQDAGRYFWQDYVERLTQRLDGLPAPDGGESFPWPVPGCGRGGNTGRTAKHPVGGQGPGPFGRPRPGGVRAADSSGALLCSEPALPGARPLPAACPVDGYPLAHLARRAYGR